MLGDGRRWVLLATIPLFIVLYFFYTFFLEHYAILIAPAVAMSIALAPAVLVELFPKHRAALHIAGVAAVAIICISTLPGLNRTANDEAFYSPMMRLIDRELAGAVNVPAVVLFRYPTTSGEFADNSPLHEPVYNTGVAWPDDAPVVRVHDLGERNRELFDYYAKRPPQRTFYLFDRGNLADPLHELGQARDLARRP
jgi:hypothetical protein